MVILGFFWNYPSTPQGHLAWQICHIIAAILISTFPDKSHRNNSLPSFWTFWPMFWPMSGWGACATQWMTLIIIVRYANIGERSFEIPQWFSDVFPINFYFFNVLPINKKASVWESICRSFLSSPSMLSYVRCELLGRSKRNFFSVLRKFFGGLDFFRFKFFWIV